VLEQTVIVFGQEGNLDIVRFLAALFPLLKVMLTSFWGWFYIILLTLVAISVKPKDLFGLFLGVILFLGVMTGWQPNLVDMASMYLAAGPASALKGFFSLNTTGLSAGGRAILLGAVITFMLIPLILRLRITAQEILKINEQVNPQNPIPNYDEIGGLAELSRFFLRIFLSLLLTIIFIICFWKAMAGLSTTGMSLAYSYWGIPDISIPSWKPIWDINYFVPAILAAIIGAFNNRLMQKSFAFKQQLPIGCLVSGAMFMMLLVSMFFPVGLMLTLIGSSILLLAWLSIESILKPEY
jgi:hypothetical protein